VEEYWANNERREHKRFERYLEVEYSVRKKPHLKNGKTLNISKGGAKLLLDGKLPVGEILDIKVHIPEKNRRIEIEGEVVWTKETEEKDPSGKRFFHSGIKFIAIKEPFDMHFSDYISFLERQNF
jgi:c-di-GMP-binding flagellar brake protein YcgR